MFGIDIMHPIFGDGDYRCVLPYGHNENHVLADREQSKRWIPKGSYYVFGFRKDGSLDVEL